MFEPEDEEWEEQLVAVELIGMIDPDKLNVIDTQNTAVLVLYFDLHLINDVAQYLHMKERFMISLPYLLCRQHC